MVTKTCVHWDYIKFCQIVDLRTLVLQSNYRTLDSHVQGYKYKYCTVCHEVEAQNIPFYDVGISPSSV